MKIPLKIAEKILQLSKGEILPASSAKHRFVEELVEEGILEKRGRIQKKLLLVNAHALTVYLQNKYAIHDLVEYIRINKREEVSRSELVAITSDSKWSKVRTFKGFLVNSYQPVKATLNEAPIIIHPVEGTFLFIADFEKFHPEKGATIIGIENAENFRFIEQQKHLFENIKPLFVSRYPQSQSKDLIRWLQSIPNPYLHFGDFDPAGIGIYLNEFKKYLGPKATFFIPENIESLIKKHGNRERYLVQKMNFDKQSIQEDDLLSLIDLIHQYKKGVDQEVLIA